MCCCRVVGTCTLQTQMISSSNRAAARHKISPDEIHDNGDHPRASTEEDNIWWGVSTSLKTETDLSWVGFGITLDLQRRRHEDQGFYRCLTQSLA